MTRHHFTNAVQVSSVSSTGATTAQKQPFSAQDRAAAYAFTEALELTSTERVVLAVLLHRAGKLDGLAWPTSQEIADRSGMVPRSVSRIVRRLAGRGLVVPTVLPRGAILPNGLHSSAIRVVYRLTVPGIVAPFTGRSIGPALAKSTLTTTERAVLAVVLLHTGASGEAWPSYERIGLLTGLSQRAVGGAVTRLRVRGVLAARRVRPGALLPSGVPATAWRLVLRPTGQIPRELSRDAPRPKCLDTPTEVHRYPDGSAEEVMHGTSSKNAEAPSGCGAQDDEPIQTLLDVFADTLETDELGPMPDQTLRQRIAEGATTKDVRDAIAGVRLVPWRMELRSRRTVRAVFGTSQKMRGFIERANLDRRTKADTFAAHAVAEMLPLPPQVTPPPLSLSPTAAEVRERVTRVGVALKSLARPTL